MSVALLPPMVGEHTGTASRVLLWAFALAFVGGCTAEVAGYGAGAPLQNKDPRLGASVRLLPGGTVPPSTPGGATTTPGGDIPAGTNPSDGCAGLDYLGECSGNTARWCDDAGLHEKDCAATGETCGFINQVLGNYCRSQIGGVGGTQTPPGSTGPTTPTSGSDEAYCVDLINQYRATLGLSPYRLSEDLNASAANAARNDSQTGSPHGDFGSSGGGGAFAENEIPGWPLESDVRAVIRGGLEMMWNEGPGGGHYDNMTGNYTEAGCGIFVTGGNEVWSAQRFR